MTAAAAVASGSEQGSISADPPATRTRDFLAGESRRLSIAAITVIVVGLLPILVWLGWAPLASAVIANGVVKVDLNRRPVQHAEGGIVAEVKVRDGDRVNAGDPIVMLGDVSVDADKERLVRRLQSERLGITRLEAEIAMAPAPSPSPDLRQLAQGDPQVAEMIRKEDGLFRARREALVSQQALLRTQRQKVVDEVAAIDRQLKSLRQAIGHQQSELQANRNLLGSGYISAARIDQLEAAVADYQARIEERASERTRAEQRAVDIDLRSKSLESDYRQQANDQLKQALARFNEVQQDLRKTDDAARRQAVVAPVAGEVMNLAVHTPGAVIKAGETIADIVPAQARQVIEAKVRTDDIRQIRVGQRARVHLLAYRSRNLDRVEAEVVYVGADRLVEQQTQAAYYLVHVETSAQALKQAGDLVLQPGMPADVYIEGDSRTVLAYLVEPITQVMRKAGREW